MKPRLLTAVVLATVLSGCANDHYVVIPGGAGSQAQMASTLHDCKDQTMHAYFSGQSHNGAVVGGVLGGAVGGAIGGAMDASNQPTDAIKLSDLNPMIERCMRERGYDGTSEN